MVVYSTEVSLYIYIHVGIIGFGSFHNAYSWLQETYHPWNDSNKEEFAGKFSNSVCIKSKASIYGVATCSLHVPKESTQNSRKVNVSRTKVCCYLSSGSVTQVWFHQLGGGAFCYHVVAVCREYWNFCFRSYKCINTDTDSIPYAG